MAKGTWGEHALTIQVGVERFADSQANTTIFGGGLFTDDTLVEIGKAGLAQFKDTKDDEWNRPLIMRSDPFPDGTPDLTVNILFVRKK